MSETNCWFCQPPADLMVTVGIGARCLRKQLMDGEIVPGVYQLAPTRHVGELLELPYNWTHLVGHSIKAIERQEGVTIDNTSVNLTEDGGRRVMDHHHEWLINRWLVNNWLVERGLPPLPNLGMFGLMGLLSRSGAELREAGHTWPPNGF